MGGVAWRYQKKPRWHGMPAGPDRREVPLVHWKSGAVSGLVVVVSAVFLLAVVSVGSASAASSYTPVDLNDSIAGPNGFSAFYAGNMVGQFAGAFGHLV